jgi:hypothetical protein
MSPANFLLPGRLHGMESQQDQQGTFRSKPNTSCFHKILKPANAI